MCSCSSDVIRVSDDFPIRVFHLQGHAGLDIAHRPARYEELMSRRKVGYLRRKRHMQQPVGAFLAQRRRRAASPPAARSVRSRDPRVEDRVDSGEASAFSPPAMALSGARLRISHRTRCRVWRVILQCVHGGIGGQANVDVTGSGNDYRVAEALSSALQRPWRHAGSLDRPIEGAMELAELFEVHAVARLVHVQHHHHQAGTVMIATHPACGLGYIRRQSSAVPGPALGQVA